LKTMVEHWTAPALVVVGEKLTTEVQPEHKHRLVEYRLA